MADAARNSQITSSTSDRRGHPVPRRASPEKSITLQHHRLAREASKRASPARVLAGPSAHSPTRQSSGESHDTEPSDPKKWFDRSNRNPAAPYDAASMDVDPPFFQKESESSNEGAREHGPGRPGQTPFSFALGALAPPLRATVTHSSSADDYRSVIDDLTIENKRLKEELKRYKQIGPAMMRKDKLFEIKVHGLPKRKKRELEATLLEFAANLETSSTTSQRRKSGRHGKGVPSSGESMSKHASSSSSHSRPVDSAYASMSTGVSSHGPHSTGRSLVGPSVPGSRSKSASDQKVEDYLRDTPGGLFSRHVVMTDKEKKKLVVRRLEQLFTGKMGGRNAARHQSSTNLGVTPELVSSEPVTVTAMAPPTNPTPSREARIQPDASHKKPRSRDNLSASNSNDDQTQSGGNATGSGDGNGSGSGGRTGNNNTSPPTAPPPEQRPTRPRDLDPDRVQVPSENIDYIRHLGVVPREFLVRKTVSYEDVSPDAEGWVWLNLLCNLAQLHMFSVTPQFIQEAVMEKSTKFQLSPDRRKIRWRGGTDGTKFSSDSGDNSQKSPSSEDTDGSNASGQRKKLKTSTTGGGTMSGTMSKFGPQVSGSSDSFHYKPLFVHRASSAEMSMEESGSQASEGALDDSNLGHSKWDYSGSGSSLRKKRRHDGAIIYYNGAPFCTDLSGDPGDLSPTTYLTSTGQEAEVESPENPSSPSIHRTLSGSSLVIRPLSEPRPLASDATRMDIDSPPELLSDDGSLPGHDVLFPWGADLESVQFRPVEPILEPCGLGGVLPEDHFAVVVTTRRPIQPAASDIRYRGPRAMSEDTAEAIARRLESMSTSSPLPPRTPILDHLIQIEYLDGKVLRLSPAQLPPPAIFFPPFSTDSDSDGSDELSESEDEDMSDGNSILEGLISQRANPHQSDNTYPEPGDLVEGGVDSDENMSDGSNGLVPSLRPPKPVRIAGASTGKRPVGSSVATAGGAESGYSSSLEDEDS